MNHLVEEKPAEPIPGFGDDIKFVASFADGRPLPAKAGPAADEAKMLTSGDVPGVETGMVPFAMVADRLARKPVQRNCGLQAVAFLSQIYRLSRDSQPRAASDKIFDYIESSLEAGVNERCDEVLWRAEPRRLSPTIIVAILTVTAPARGKLRAYQTFLSRAADALVKAVGDDEAKAILKYYR